MNIYPHSSAIIMTDDVFQAYGGLLANTSEEQRKSAYFIAEEAASQDISTLLLPTIVTGSYSYHSPFLLGYGYVHNVYSVKFIDFEEDVYYTVTGTGNIYVAIQDKKYGILDINYFLSNCHCSHHGSQFPYKIDVVYEAGLPTGVANRPDVLLALTTYSQIILNEIIGYGNEAPGDVGVTDYQNQSYRENRVGLLRTSFGTSAKANFAHNLLTKYRAYRNVGMI